MLALLATKQTFVQSESRSSSSEFGACADHAQNIGTSNVSARAQQKLYRTADCLGGEAESNERWQIKMQRRVKNKSFSVLFSQGQPFGNQCINARLLDGKLTSHGLCSPILQNSLTWGQAEENHHHQTCISTHIRLHLLRLEKQKTKTFMAVTTEPDTSSSSCPLNIRIGCDGRPTRARWLGDALCAS